MFEWTCRACCVWQRHCAGSLCLDALRQVQSLVKGLSSSGQVLGAPCERGFVCELCGTGVMGTKDGKRVKRKSGDVEGQGKWRAKWKVWPQKLWKRGEQTVSPQREELSDTGNICKAESCTFCKETHGACINPTVLTLFSLCLRAG